MGPDEVDNSLANLRISTDIGGSRSPSFQGRGLRPLRWNDSNRYLARPCFIRTIERHRCDRIAAVSAAGFLFELRRRALDFHGTFGRPTDPSSPARTRTPRSIAPAKQQQAGPRPVQRGVGPWNPLGSLRSSLIEGRATAVSTPSTEYVSKPARTSFRAKAKTAQIPLEGPNQKYSSPSCSNPPESAAWKSTLAHPQPQRETTWLMSICFAKSCARSSPRDSRNCSIARSSTESARSSAMAIGTFGIRRLTDPSSPASSRTRNSSALATQQRAARSPVQRGVSRRSSIHAWRRMVADTMSVANPPDDAPPDSPAANG